MAPADEHLCFCYALQLARQWGRKREGQRDEGVGGGSWRRAKTLAGNDAAQQVELQRFCCVFRVFATVISIKCSHALHVCVFVCVCVQLP